ncbi:MAG: AMP-binding protein, partial [Deltaproteobacteria bacterium]|nr:AMP-binding protein [Deltaproteobacteria bacterium]
RVGLLMENRPEWIELALAATGLGALLVPVSTFSKQDDLAWQLRHADVAQLFMSASFLGNDYLAMLRATAPEIEAGRSGALRCASLPALRRVVVFGGDALPTGAQSWSDFCAGADEVSADLVDQLAAEVDPEDDCYLLYTSGTTARPKGVLQTHGAVAGNGWRIGEYQLLECEDVVWFYFPLFFSAGCINVMLGTFSHGGSLILQPAFDPGPALALIERERATTWHLWAHQLGALTAHPDWNERDHSLLHKGTAPFDAMLGGPPKDGIGGVNMYGLTETCTAFSCTRGDEPLKTRITSNGPLMPGNAMKIVDPETGERLGDGEEGELCVKGPSVMRRYYKIDPAETFDAEGFFHTGDLGHIDERGHVHFNQRIKDMIKTGGINVSPAEIEMKLVQAKGVEAAHAFPIPAGAEGEAVGAAIVVSEGAGPDVGALQSHYAESLPGYKRPRALLILRAGQVPMTGSGKVQKVRLRERLLEQLDGAVEGIVSLL